MRRGRLSPQIDTVHALEKPFGEQCVERIRSGLFIE